MAGIRRDHVIYAGAALLGFAAVPLMHLYGISHYISIYRTELVFLSSSLLLIGAAASLWKHGIAGSRLWAGLRIVGVLLLLPLAAVTGFMVYEAQDAWRDHGVHWHADFAVVVDGEEKELISSYNFCDDGDFLCGRQNRTGGPKFHEHDDMRIHLHGPVLEREDATLAAFFDGFNGKLAADELRYPTDDGWVNVTEDGENTLKVLVKQETAGVPQWCAIDPDVEDPCTVHDTGEPVHDPADYIISPHIGYPMDLIFFIYDNATVDEALAEVQGNDAYHGIRPGP